MLVTGVLHHLRSQRQRQSFHMPYQTTSADSQNQNVALHLLTPLIYKIEGSDWSLLICHRV